VSENIRRVWQFIPDFVRYIDEKTDEIRYRRKDNMSYPSYNISFGRNMIVDGMQVKTPPITLKANPCGQYIVEPNAPEYDLIVKVMSAYVADSNDKLKEISQLINDNKAQVGQLPEQFVPQGKKHPADQDLLKKLADAEARIKELQRKQENGK